MKVKVTLSIGYPAANREDTIDVDDDDYNACETDDERYKLLSDYWPEWSNDHIEGGWKIIGALEE